MSSRNLRIKQRLALAGLVLFGLAGCGAHEDVPDQAADCVVAALSADQRFQQGIASFGGSPLSLGLTIKASCAPATLLGAAANADLLAKTAQKLVRDKHYKAGQYTALLGASPEPTSTATLFSAYLERTAQVRTAVLRCVPGSQTAISNVSELDWVFTMAVLYRQGYARSSEEATAKASVLIKTVSERAKALDELPCGEPLTTEFQLLGEDSVAFFRGEHPWAPGCRPEVLDTEVLLKCDKLPTNP